MWIVRIPDVDMRLTPYSRWMRSISIRVLLAVAAGAAATAFAFPQPAAATMITDLECLSAGGRFRCDLTLNTLNSKTITWEIDGVWRRLFDQKTTVTSSCTVGRLVLVQVSVSNNAADDGYSEDGDGGHHTETRTTWFPCLPVAQ
jgi:hypothetical protein